MKVEERGKTISLAPCCLLVGHILFIKSCFEKPTVDNGVKSPEWKKSHSHLQNSWSAEDG